MKKQSEYSAKDAPILNVKNDRIPRGLVIAAAILYSISLVLLANLVWAKGVEQVSGGLIKVSNSLDAAALAHIKVKSVHGNILSIETNGSSISRLNNTKGVCAGQLDHTVNKTTPVKAVTANAKYAEAGVVLGILDNSGTLCNKDLAQLQKVEAAANVGFISYLSADPESTVIMRNLHCGESNLVQALAYMQQYAITVNRPLIIEMVLNGNEMQNPLFVQVCQQVAESGVQFIGAHSFAVEQPVEKRDPQFAFCTFNAETGQITDRSDFWAINEVKQQQIMLLGSDKQACAISFQKEAGFDKIYISNASLDVAMIMVLTADGEVNYYHIKNKETALIPRMLFNGTPVLEDGYHGIYPYFTKKALFNGAVAQNRFVKLKEKASNIQLRPNSGMLLTVTSPSTRTLIISLKELDRDTEINLHDATGKMVYQRHPSADVKDIQANINLSENSGGLYFLGLTSPGFKQTLALQLE